MKRLFLPIVCLLFLCSIPSRSVCYAQDVPYIVIGENIWLIGERGERIFLLPETYYAPIVGMDENYYSVSFNGVVGKVAKSSVSAIGYRAESVGTSQVLHVSEKYAAFTGLKIRSSPESGSEETNASVPIGETFTYLGSYPIGEEVWYYIIYDNHYGYVLSDFCDKKVETVPFVPETNNEVKAEEKKEAPKETKDDSLLKILIIAGVSVTFVILFLVLLIPKKGKKTRYYYET